MCDRSWARVGKGDHPGRFEIRDFPGGSDGKVSTTVQETRVCGGSGISSGEGNAPHSSTLAWKIPWTEEPSGLQSMGSQRVGHD